MNINPMWFYWIEILENLNIAMIILSAALVVTGIVYIVTGKTDVDIPFNEEDQQKGLRHISIGIKLCVASAALVLLCVFIPSKQTMIEMKIAQFATKENGEFIINSIKETVDYICGKLGELR